MSSHGPDEQADERLARDAAQLLRQSADELDAATASRLNRARQRALAEVDRRHPRPAWQAGWRPALGAAAVALLVVVLWPEPGTGPGAPGSNPAPVLEAAAGDATDLDLLLAEDNLDMLAELEFYDWLAAGDGMPEGLDPGLTG
ncbi:MAG: hypothetical protein QY320_01365 [Gammaproteobacteria bacterium]|nr:MAG: hypothetical protein QY320_01365 [Gammaproteobacteria bacterium]